MPWRVMPKFCCGTTAIFIIVFCLLCSFTTLGPKFIEMMIQEEQHSKQQHASRERQEMAELPTIDTSTCEIQQVQDPKHHVQANFLASYPGSGARLLAKLVEAITGIATTDDVFSNGARNTVGISTYYPCVEGQETAGADAVPRVIILIRHPMEAIPSYHNLLYQQMNNVPVAPVDDWRIWSTTKLVEQIEIWAKHLEYWVDRYPPKYRLAVSYDQLLSPYQGPKVALALGEFLSLSEGVSTVLSDDIPCIWQRLIDEYEKSLPISERKKRSSRIPHHKQLAPSTHNIVDRRESYHNHDKRDSDHHSNKNHDKDNGPENVSYERENAYGDDNNTEKSSTSRRHDEDNSPSNTRRESSDKRSSIGRGEDRSVPSNKNVRYEGDEEPHQSREVSTESRSSNRFRNGAGGDHQDRPSQEASELDRRSRRQKGRENDQPNSMSVKKGRQMHDDDQEKERSLDGYAGGNDTRERHRAQQDRIIVNGITRSKSSQGKGHQDDEGVETMSHIRDGSTTRYESDEAYDRRISVDQRRNNGLSHGERQLIQNQYEMKTTLARRRLREKIVRKEFSPEGRRELVVQLSRLVEKYQQDEHLSGILIEFIDELVV